LLKNALLALNTCLVLLCHMRYQGGSCIRCCCLVCRCPSYCGKARSGRLART
jgi:hypothetical protein